MKVIVIGAGIGGSVLAMSLQQLGIDHVLIEQAPGFSEVGAGIQLSPNGVRVLETLGLGDALRGFCTEPDFQRIVILEAPSVLGEDSADPPQAIRYLTERLEPVVARQSLDAEAVAYSIYGTMQAMAQPRPTSLDPPFAPTSTISAGLVALSRSEITPVRYISRWPVRLYQTRCRTLDASITMDTS